MTDALSFFLDRYLAEVPVRIHSRDTNEGGGPEWHRSFESWLTDGDGKWQTGLYDETEHCQHPTNERPCPACGDSGLRVRIRHTYRHPVKRTLRVLQSVHVPKDRPRLHVVLEVLAANEGNYILTAQALRSEYAFMWDRERATRFINYALTEFRRCYQEHPALVTDRSDAQLNAEVAA